VALVGSLIHHAKDRRTSYQETPHMHKGCETESQAQLLQIEDLVWIETVSIGDVIHDHDGNIIVMSS